MLWWGQNSTWTTAASVSDVTSLPPKPIRCTHVLTYALRHWPFSLDSGQPFARGNVYQRFNVHALPLVLTISFLSFMPFQLTFELVEEKQRRAAGRMRQYTCNHGCAIGRECDKTRNCNPQPIPHLAALSCPCCAAPSAEGSLIATWSCDDHDDPPSLLFVGHSQHSGWLSQCCGIVVQLTLQEIQHDWQMSWCKVQCSEQLVQLNLNFVALPQLRVHIKWVIWSYFAQCHEHTITSIVPHKSDLWVTEACRLPI